MLAAVLQHQGSSPGKAGAKLAWTESGASHGSVGGGAVEHAVLERAKAMLDQGCRAAELYAVRHQSTAGAEASGMLCGGSQTTALYLCTERDLPTLEAVADAWRQQRGGVWQLGPAGMAFAAADSLPQPRLFQHGGIAPWRYAERVGVVDTAYIVGGGHVGLALSRLLATLEFRVVVWDERDGLATLAANEAADEILVAGYEAVAERIAAGRHSYVFIMTHCHARDQAVLQRLLDKDLAYLGLLGSRHKVRRICAELGLHAGNIPAHFHAPMGLPIYSATPAEIAVSIAAEVIGVRHALL